MSTRIEPSLREVATAQHGLFTTQQALRAGMSAFALVDAVKNGALLHPGRGLYAVRDLVDPSSPPAWHRTRAFGASLLWQDAMLTGVSAVLAHDVPVWGADLSRVHVLRPLDRSVRLPSYRVRQWRGQPATETTLGRAVELSHALAQHAVDHGIVPGVVSADRALNAGLVTVADLEAAADVVGAWRHGSRALAMVSFANPLHESVGESRCAVTLAVGGLVLQPQVEIRDGSGHLVGRVDFLVTGTRVVVEFDGRVKYDSGDPAVLWAEKKREDALRRLGYVVVRLTWADLERPGTALAKVRSAIAAA
jgi:hypothetical protein